MFEKIRAYKWSDTFIELFTRDGSNLNMDEYQLCLNEFIEAHEKAAVRNFIYSITLFLGGLWAVAAEVWFMAVLLLAFAYNCNRQSSSYTLMLEIHKSQNLLAKLINNPSEQRIKTEQKANVEKDVVTFSETYPHFDELSDTIASLIREGMTLEGAYYKALSEAGISGLNDMK